MSRSPCLSARGLRRIACAALSAALTSGAASLAHATPNEPVVAIDAGSSGNAGWYGPETGTFSGGSTYTTASAIDVTRTYYAAPAAVYQTARQGNASFTLGGLSANGRYTVRLHFADPDSTAANQRKFHVAVGGATALSNYDIFADAGRAVAVVKHVNAVANASGQISVQLTSVTGNALISAIDVLPGYSYFINAGSAGSGAYQADAFANGGNTFSTTQPINTAFVHSAPPQSVYQTERYHSTGDLIYTLPNLAPNQRYDVRLHFAEIDPNHGYVGARQFDVLLNSTRVLAKFDPYDAGGGLHIATARSFEAVADTNGQIIIKLKRIWSDPKLSAIEVRPQLSFKFNAGGSASGAYDNDRSRYLTTSTSGTLNTASTVDTTGVANAAPSAVYQVARVESAPFGAVTYNLAGLAPDKLYRVRLHFAEIDPSKFSEGARKVTVKINGNRVLPDFDIFKAAGGGYKAVVKDVTYSADENGRLAISFHNAKGGALINGIEVDREAPASGYFVTDVGAQKRYGGAFVPSSVFASDGGCSAQVGSNVLWAYGDTLFRDYSVTPTGFKSWNNTGTLSSLRDLANVLEVTDATGGPAGQLIPNLDRYLEYNQAHHKGYGCTGTCDSTYYAMWPGAILPWTNGSGLVLAAAVVVGGNSNTPKGEGVITYVQQPGQWPSHGTLDESVMSHATLFAFEERLFTRGFKAEDGFVYLYRAERGVNGLLGSALTSGVNTNQLQITAEGLADAVMEGQQIELVYNDHRQVVTVAASVGPSHDTAIPVETFQPNFNYPADQTLVQKVMTPIGKLSTSLAAGVARTSVPLANPLPVGLLSGQQFELFADEASGIQRVQVVTASANVAAGATSIPVASFTPAITYAVNTQVHQSKGYVAPPYHKFWNATYVARAPAATANQRATYEFWSQAGGSGDYKGGWVTGCTGIADGTPMLYTDASIGLMDTPSVAWNPHLNKYLVVRALQANDGLYMSSTTHPWGPWAPEALITKVHTHESYGGAYFISQHPEANLGNGQTVHVTYAGSGPEFLTGSVRVVRVTLP